MSDCIGPINIIPNNNQVNLQDVNRTITVIDNNCCTTVDVTQPVTSIIQVLTGPMGSFPTIGPYGFTGSFDISGSLTVTGSIYGDTIYSPYFTGSFYGNGTGIFSGSFSGSISSNLQDVTNNGNVTTLPITASSFYGNGLQIIGDATITGSLTISSSNTFKNIGPAQFTGSLDITGSGTLNGYPLLTSNDTGSLLLSSSFNNFTSSYYLDSASFDTRILNNSSSISLLSGSYLNSSASFDNRILNNSSSIALLSSSFLSTSGSLSTRVTALENFSSSLDDTFATDAELNYSSSILSGSIAYLSSSYLNSSASFNTRILNNSSSIALLSGSFINFSSSYNTGSFTGSFTGSLFGTSSWSNNAITASYASTASLAPNYLPLTGGTINGNVIVNGTASVTFLNVTYESSSVIYSSGSNQFGDATNDTQLLIGKTIVSGSFEVTGSTNIPNLTGSLLGTASYSKFAETSSNILGGKATHVPFFITDTSLATSSIYQSGSSTVIINQDNATSAAPEALYVWQPSTSSFNVISGKGNLNNYLQLNIQNTNQGIDASSDVVATANNGSENDNYIDMGINSENYTGFLGGPNDAYLYAHSNNLWIGNVNDGYKVYFFNSSSEQPIITLNSDNAEVTGSLFGTASWAENAITSSNAITASYALTASYASNVPATASFAISSSYAITASYAANVPVTASYAISASHANNADSSLTAISASHALNADNAINATYAATAGNGGVTQLIAGSGITLIPAGGQGAVTIASSGGGGVTIISGSLVTGSFVNATSYTFNHNLNTRTPIITVFDSNYNQIIPQNIQLVDTASAIITFPTQETGFAIGSTGGTTGTAYSSSYALFSTYADTASFVATAQTASYYLEKDPIFVAKSASLATTGSNTFKGNQIVTGSLFTTGSNTLIGNTILSGSLIISGSQTFYGTSTSIGTQIVTGSLLTSGSQTLVGNTTLSGSIDISGSQTFYGTSVFYGNHTLSGSNTILGNTVLSGSLEVSGSTILHNNIFIVTGSTLIKGQTQISGSTSITGSFNVTNGDINVVSGSSFTRWGNKLFNYGQYANTGSIPLTANVSSSFTLPYTYFQSGISITSGSRITFENTGLYNIQFSAVANQGTGVRNLHIWFKKTGSNIDNSDTLVTIQNNSQTLLGWNFAYPYNADEYVELWYHTDGANTSFTTNPSGSGFPLSPSLILTVTQIA